jgi:hypothetical protein
MMAKAISRLSNRSENVVARETISVLHICNCFRRQLKQAGGAVYLPRASLKQHSIDILDNC